MEVVKITEVSGKTMCIDPQAGEKVYEKVLTLLKQGTHVDLSFEGVTTIITAFLNVAVGKLCNPAVLDHQTFDELLTFSDANEDQRAKVVQVIKTAKIFYSNPAQFKKIYTETE